MAKHRSCEGIDVYIEETGAGDGDIKVTVEGEEYTAEANHDHDGDGVDDTVTVITEDGFVAYVDEDGDGAADIMQTVDQHDTVVEQARFDPATGRWYGETPQPQPFHAEPPAETGNALVVDTPDGDQQVGPATEDTDADGRADTAIVATDAGSLLVTDVDGDGSADQVVRIADTGEVTVSQHTGDGAWAVVDQGRIGADGSYHAEQNPLSPAVGTDDVTWTFDEDEPARGPGEQHGPARRVDDDSFWI